MLTEEEIKTYLDNIERYYANLLIAQYNGKEKASKTIDLVAKKFAIDNIFTQIQQAFDLETAIGKQLDILGKIVGIDRNLEGSLIGDEDFRVLIKLKIIRNNLDYTVKNTDELLFQFFGNDLKANSGFNMTMSFWFSGGSDSLAEMAIKKDVLPRPMGVGMAIITTETPIFTMVDSDFISYDVNFAGFFADPADILTDESEFILSEDIN